jgi:gluconokinase
MKNEEWVAQTLILHSTFYILHSLSMLLGVDIGTTNLKALAVDPATGQPIAHASRPVTTLTPKTGWAEQDPATIWSLLQDVLAEVQTELTAASVPISGVCFSTAMHSLLAIDGAGKPLTNAIIWSDNRAAREAADLRTHHPDVARAIGVPLHPMLPFCKLAWFNTHNPRLLKRAARWLSLKEYIWWQLTGRYEIDYAMAGATGLFNNATRTWHRPALALAGVRPDQLSAPVNSNHIARYVPTAGVPAGQQGLLPANTPLVIGSSDGCLANLGAGAIEPGVTTITIGTSGAVRRTSPRPVRDERLFSYLLLARSNAEPDYYAVGGPTNNGANVLEWLSEKLVQQDPAAVLAEAANVPAGSDGLLFRPYLQGERAPLWDATVRGSYHFVDWQHTQAHFARAALEGVLFNLRRTELLLARQAGPTRVIHANGGFAQSDFWVQLMADIFGVPVRLNASNESGAIGAIKMAQFALAAESGTLLALSELAVEVAFGKTVRPNPEAVALYRKQYKRFEAL